MYLCDGFFGYVSFLCRFVILVICVCCFVFVWSIFVYVCVSANITIFKLNDFIGFNDDKHVTCNA